MLLYAPFTSFYIPFTFFYILLHPFGIFWILLGIYNSGILWPAQTGNNKDGSLASAQVGWNLKGAMLYNVIVALTLSSCFHTYLNLTQRCENALSGYIALDIFKMIAEDYCTNEGLPRGSCFLAPQTMVNMQACALSLITVCVSKDPSFAPWNHGFGRMTELAIEQTFGHLRVQSRNAQLSTRAFMQADARQALRHSKQLNQHRVPAIPKGDNPLTETELLPFVSSLFWTPFGFH